MTDFLLFLLVGAVVLLLIRLKNYTYAVHTRFVYVISPIIFHLKAILHFLKEKLYQLLALIKRIFSRQKYYSEVKQIESYLLLTEEL